jgi:hypothetical protein
MCLWCCWRDPNEPGFNGIFFIFGVFLFVFILFGGEILCPG